MKNIFITGATDGIGKLVATRLASDGHRMSLHGRNVEKLRKVVSEIKQVTGNDNVWSYTADFADLDSVIGMSNQLKKNCTKLDVLINNAGIFKSPQELNSDGIDIRIVVNYFASYLLTKELLPLLDKGNQARVVNLSSAAQSPITKELLRGQQDVSAQEAYAQSKLALTMWSFDLARKHPSLNSIAVNPGSLLNTKMANEA